MPPPCGNQIYIIFSSRGPGAHSRLENKALVTSTPHVHPPWLAQKGILMLDYPSRLAGAEKRNNRGDDKYFRPFPMAMLTEINNKSTWRWLCVSMYAIDYLLSCVHCQLTVAERSGEEEGVTVVSCAVTPQFPPHKTRSLAVALFLSLYSRYC